MQEERADSGQFQQVLRLPRQQAQAKSDNLLLETYRFVFSRLSRCNKPEILRKNRGRGQRRTRCLASWNTETWCETPFKNSRNARTRAHTHPYTRARARLSTDIKRGQKKPRSGGCSFSRGSNTKDLSAGQPNSFGI